MLTVQTIYDLIDQVAPFDTQVPHDNSGLLVGDASAEVHAIHVALDATPHTVQEAIANGADLLITHHPLMFSPIQQLTEAGYESRLIMAMVRHGISHIAAHTNLDMAPGGIDDVLAARLGLTNLVGEGFIRIGDLPHPMTAAELTAHAAACLNTVVRPMGRSDAPITRLAICSGAGGDEWPGVLPYGAQAFLTGEMKHHIALEATASGLFCLEAGHHATEEPGIFALADTLQNALNQVQYKVPIFHSQAGAYGSAGRP